MGLTIAFEEFGAVGDGRDDWAALMAAVAAAPPGGTVSGAAGKIYGLSRTFAPPKRVRLVGQGCTFMALGAMKDVCATTDIDGMQWEDLVIDGNHVAVSGVTSYAHTRDVSGVRFHQITVRNLPHDHTLNAACVRALSGTGHRHKNPQAAQITLRNTGALGIQFVDADDPVIAGVDGVDVENHLSEFIGCRNAIGSGYRGRNIGGSTAACGAGSNGVSMTDIVSDGAEGDAAITSETNSANVRVDDFTATNTWKAGISCNYGGRYVYPNDTNREASFTNGMVRAAAPKAITGGMRSKPCKLVVPNHGIRTIYLSNTVQVSIAGVAGMTQLNGTTPTVTTIDPATGLHDPNAVWLVNVDSRRYSAYTNGGTIAPFANGANCYGSTPPQMEHVVIRSVQVHDYNTCLAMLYGHGCEALDISGSGLQGPQSAVARFTYQTRFKLTGLHYGDTANPPTDPRGAVQFLTDPGNAANVCDAVQITDISVATSIGPLIYLEGNGTFEIDGLHTDNAPHFISIGAGASPTIHLRNFTGNVTGAPFLIGRGAAPVWDIE